MTHPQLADMTYDDLKALVDEVVAERLGELFKPHERRSVQEINAEIRRLRWTPPTDAPSNLELLREDRDR